MARKVLRTDIRFGFHDHTGKVSAAKTPNQNFSQEAFSYMKCGLLEELPIKFHKEMKKEASGIIVMMTGASRALQILGKF